jgi:hypothetical protein
MAMRTTTNENAGCPPGAESANQSTNNAKIITKLDRVIEALKQPQGLNRFEAERIGDHCLNSSVAVIRAMYGNRLIQHWETVPTRHSPNGVRVYRYRLI